MKKIMYSLVLLGLFFVPVNAGTSYLSTSYTVTPDEIYSGGSAKIIVTFADTSTLLTLDELEARITTVDTGISVSSDDDVKIGTVQPLSSTSAVFTVKTASNTPPGAYTVEVRGNYRIMGVSYTYKINIPITVVSRANLEIIARETQVVPGGSENLLLTIGNPGSGGVRNAIISLSPTEDEVYPIESQKKNIDLLLSKQETELTFKIRASDSATVGIHPMTVTVEYSDENSVTKTFSTSVGIVVVEAGTELMIDSVDSKLEPGITKPVTIAIKNVGTVDLENLYLSLTASSPLQMAGSNEELIEKLGMGETKQVTFYLDVDNDAEARPVDATLSINYQRTGSKKQLTDTKSLGVQVNGFVDLRVIDMSVDKKNGEIEVDVANYGNKDAEAVKLELLQDGAVIGTGFTDKIKPDKHKVFRFDLPSKPELTVKATFKDFDSESGVSIIEETISLDPSDLKQNGGDGTAGILLVLAIAVIGFWYWRKKSGKKVNIDVSKFQ
ncbi:MAG: COG1361 S-layer family protein [Candidatus Altiarchaeota archaeon]|nr:COG1361 S-layer family protein [Candidatus Altiarchaeota archaeon]